MDPIFHTTRWSVVLTAGAGDNTRTGAALAELCQIYWYPLYAYARRKGVDSVSAEDLTQEFFSILLEKNWVEDADPARGKFRAYLLTAFKRHMIKTREEARTQKRGGGKNILSLDFSAGERLFSLEPAHADTPERIFARQWSLTVLKRVMDGLEAEMASLGKADQFQELRPFLSGGAGADSYRVVAERLGMTEGAVKTAMHRLRNRYRDRLRGEIADTVVQPGDVDEEIRFLIQSLQG